MKNLTNTAANRESLEEFRIFEKCVNPGFIQYAQEMGGVDENFSSHYAGKEFRLFLKEYIKPVYEIYGFYVLASDYYPEGEPEEGNVKYTRIGEDWDDAYCTDTDLEIYDFVDCVEGDKAEETQDWAFFCNDANFERVQVADQYYEREMSDDVWLTGSCEYEEMEFEGWTMESVWNDRPGNQGYDEICAFYNEEGKFEFYALRPVSYLQGSDNNSYVVISEAQAEAIMNR